MIGRIIERVCCLYYTFPGFGRTNSFNFAWRLDYYFYYYLCFCLNCLFDRNISIGGFKKNALKKFRKQNTISCDVIKIERIYYAKNEKAFRRLLRR